MDQQAQTQADKVGERGRASAIGVLSGVAMAGFVLGTLTSRFLSTTLTFRVSASVAVYMRVFLVESNRAGTGGGPANEGNVSQAFLEAKTSAGVEAREETSVLSSSKGASLWDMIRLLRSSLAFLRAAILAFFSSLGDGGLHSSLLECTQLENLFGGTMSTLTIVIWLQTLRIQIQLSSLARNPLTWGTCINHL